jgi:hypothetical protein
MPLASQGRKPRTATLFESLALSWLVSFAGVGCSSSFGVDASPGAGAQADGAFARDASAGDDGMDATTEASALAADDAPARDDAARIDAAPCTVRGDAGVDFEWALWPVPNLPADIEAGAGQPQSYTDNGDGTVTDNVTRLMWERSTGYGTFVQAQSYCTNLTLAGHCDWRVPSYVELHSIADYGSSPAVNGTYFPGTASTNFWASTPAAGMPGVGWRINFAQGNAGWATLTDAQYVRCVR